MPFGKKESSVSCSFFCYLPRRTPGSANSGLRREPEYTGLRPCSANPSGLESVFKRGWVAIVAFVTHHVCHVRYVHHVRYDSPGLTDLYFSLRRQKLLSPATLISTHKAVSFSFRGLKALRGPYSSTIGLRLLRSSRVTFVTFITFITKNN